MKIQQVLMPMCMCKFPNHRKLLHSVEYCYCYILLLVMRLHLRLKYLMTLLLVSKAKKLFARELDQQFQYLLLHRGYLVLLVFAIRYRSSVVL